VLFVLAALAQQTVQDPRDLRFRAGVLGIGADPRPVTMDQLLRLRPIHDELELTKSQRSMIEKADDEAARKRALMMKAGYAQIRQELGERPDPDALRSFREANKDAIMAEHKAILSEAETARLRVLDRRQRARLQQIQLQAEGPLAFTRPEVVEKLNLDPEQLALLHLAVSQGQVKIANAALVRVDDVGGGPAADVEKRSAEQVEKRYAKSKKRSLDAVVSAREEVMRSIARILRKSQRDTYRKLIGEPFELSKIRNAPVAPPSAGSSSGGEKSAR
jgi:hypothetical protein